MAGTAPTTPNYDVNYEDERFVTNEANKQAALSESNQMYDQMIEQSGSFYENQIEASKQWAEQQQQLQQDQTDFAIEQVEQQRDKTQKDYIKEQAGAYADWKKQSNQYGVNAEQMAASGMTNTGYSESSQVSMYNTYQNRVATAKQAVNDANLQYDNMIQQAILENNVAKAEIAYQAYQTQLQLALEGFQYNNELLFQQTAAKQQIEATYEAQRQAILDQINRENALAEEVRQYNANLLEEQRQYDANMALQKELAAQEQANWEREYAYKQQLAAQEQANWEKEYELSKAKSTTTTNTYGTVGDSGTDNTQSSRPDTISGYGKVTETKNYIETEDGNLTLYTTSNGKMWYWNGAKYVEVELEEKATGGGGKTRTDATNNTSTTVASGSNIAPNRFDRKLSL